MNSFKKYISIIALGILVASPTAYAASISADSFDATLSSAISTFLGRFAVDFTDTTEGSASSAATVTHTSSGGATTVGELVRDSLKAVLNDSGNYGEMFIDNYDISALKGEGNFTGTLNSGGWSNALYFSGVRGVANYTGSMEFNNDNALVNGGYFESKGDAGNGGNVYHNGVLVNVSGEADVNAGVQVRSVTGGTHNYGIYIYSPSSGENNYAIYSDSAAKSSFGGDVGIGTNEPTSKLDVDGDNIRIRQSKTPTSSSDSCEQGEVAWDSGYVYVCVAQNSWMRSALSTF